MSLSLATRDHRKLWARTKEVFRNALGGIGDKVESVQLDELTVKLRAGVGTEWVRRRPSSSRRSRPRRRRW